MPKVNSNINEIGKNYSPWPSGKSPVWSIIDFSLEKPQNRLKKKKKNLRLLRLLNYTNFR